MIDLLLLLLVPSMSSRLRVAQNTPHFRHWRFASILPFIVWGWTDYVSASKPPQKKHLDF
jgi:hypothetical protein